MRKFRFLLLTVILAVSIGAIGNYAQAKKIKQAHKIETAKGKTAVGTLEKLRVISVETDSLLSDSVRFSGYDKPVNATQESFHITNTTGMNIKKVGIRITYLDLQNRMMHVRDAEAECDVPDGETRLAAIPTWDRQRTFYYYLGPEPRRVATPYKVNISLLWIEY